MNHWGANVGVLVLADHQWWRLVTSTFVHSGIIHIATNMWCLYNLGLLGEPLMGAFGVVAAYLLTGVVGNLLSVALHPGVSVQARSWTMVSSASARRAPSLAWPVS